MQYHLNRFLAAIALLSAGAPAGAQVEQGAASTTPWSGWWWPSQHGHLIHGYRGEQGPMVKHDQVTGKRAATWEHQSTYHYSPGGADWWGHCHAWAGASVLEPEPLHDVYYGGVPFHVGDM